MKTEALHRLNKMITKQEPVTGSAAGTTEPEALPVNMKQKRSTNIHFRVDDRTLAKIENLAAKYGCSKTEVIITAIKKMK